MKRRASASHDEAIVRRLPKDSDFAAEYFKAASEDEDEPHDWHAVGHRIPPLGGF